MGLEAYRQTDAILFKAAEVINTLHYLSPQNLGETKMDFMAGRADQPEFTYRDLRYDPKVMAKALTGLEIPAGDLEQVFRREKENMLWENMLVADRGNPILVKLASQQVYGVPSAELIVYADKVLRVVPERTEVKTVSADRIKAALADVLAELGLTDWHVELTDDWLTMTYAIDKKITVCRNRLFTEIDLRRLGAHEVGVHAVRAENGSKQPIKLFQTGLPGFLPTEEGLTAYLEELADCANPEMQRDYAGRVIAVDSVCEELTFRQTFDRLKSYRLSDDQAWTLTARAFRGGGFVKDHVYLEGYLAVREFVERGGSLTDLFVGKIGLTDLPLVDRLLNGRELTAAGILPVMLQEKGLHQRFRMH